MMLSRYALFEAAATDDVATLDAYFAQPPELERALALEARISDDAIADVGNRFSQRSALVPAATWVYLHDRQNHVFAIEYRCYEALEWFFTSAISTVLPRTLQLFLVDAASSAIARKQPDMLEMLLTSNAWTQFPNIARPAFLSALVKDGISTRSLRTLNLLVAHGADVNRELMGHGPPFSYAAGRGCSMARWMYGYGVVTVGDGIALHRAAEHGDSEAIPVLLELGVDPCACNSDLETAVHRAAEEGYHATIDVLLSSACIDMDVQNIDGSTALNLVVQMNPFDDEDMNDEGFASDDAFHPLAVDVLLKHGADPEMCCFGDNEYAPLHWAVSMSRANIVKSLLSRGANPNVQTTTTRQTPAHVLIGQGDLSTKAEKVLFDLLIEHGADLALPDANGVTPQDRLNAAQVSELPTLQS